MASPLRRAFSSAPGNAGYRTFSVAVRNDGQLLPMPRSRGDVCAGDDEPLNDGAAGVAIAAVSQVAAAIAPSGACWKPLSSVRVAFGAQMELLRAHVLL
jgi:hypothetical protein